MHTIYNILAWIKEEESNVMLNVVTCDLFIINISFASFAFLDLHQECVYNDLKR